MPAIVAGRARAAGLQLLSNYDSASPGWNVHPKVTQLANVFAEYGPC
jgi:hypothetical protein